MPSSSARAACGTSICPSSCASRRYFRSASGVNIGAVAEVETNRFHDPERCARGEYIGPREYAGVLLDDRRCSGVRDRVEVLLDPGPGVLAVLLEIRRGIKRVD